MLKISAVYLIGNPEIPIHYTSWSQVEQALLMITLGSSQKSLPQNISAGSVLLKTSENFVLYMTVSMYIYRIILT